MFSHVAFVVCGAVVNFFAAVVFLVVTFGAVGEVDFGDVATEDFELFFFVVVVITSDALFSF